MHALNHPLTGVNGRPLSFKKNAENSKENLLRIAYLSIPQIQQYIIVIDSFHSERNEDDVGHSNMNILSMSVACVTAGLRVGIDLSLYASKLESSNLV
ncbi:hypothetical protein CEXT_717811 [Caerostris extrusa]|uniref:Uncharacterized protein n=1 Tax=Caerostris extrusa TaxID=172846 RepID=A0AAV4SXG1_CAEEX|nr:hypothetical protein CEXT_717811 [Caerostris extrusa]